MAVEERYQWDFREAANKVFGTEDLKHPMVAEMNRWSRTNVSGRIQMLQHPTHHDHHELHLSPVQTRARLEAFGRRNVIAFQANAPVTGVHQEAIERLAADMDASILVHPVVGMVRPGDVAHHSSVRAYEALNEAINEQSPSLLALLPLAETGATKQELAGATLNVKNAEFTLQENRKDLKGFLAGPTAQEMAQAHQRQAEAEVALKFAEGALAGLAQDMVQELIQRR